MYVREQNSQVAENTMLLTEPSVSCVVNREGVVVPLGLDTS